MILAKEEAEKKAIEEAKKKEAEAATADGDKAEQSTEAAQEEEAKEESKDEAAKSGSKESEKAVDTAKINALNKMLDDFENILSKNFCQFANYEDFSFAKSRTTEQLQEQFFQFFDLHF